MRVRTLTVALLLAGVLPAGALAAAGAMHPAMHPHLAAKLLGRNEVPKADPMGHGIVNLTLDQKTGTVCWAFSGVKGIAKPTAAHIHKGVRGKSGPVVVPLGGAYKAKGCTKASKMELEAIEAHPSAYYVNVHTAKYPAGAIRGQLVVGMMHL